MLRKIQIAIVVGLCALTLAQYHVLAADLTSQFQQAEQLEKAGQFAQAAAIYNQIIYSYPGTEDAFKAERRLTCAWVSMGNLTQAQVTLEKMFSDFAKHERLPHAVHEIAESCSKNGKADKACQLYQNILTSRPTHPQAVWLQMGIAISGIHLKDEKAADAAIEKLKEDFSKDSRSAEAVDQVAWCYRKLEQHQKARPLYQYVADNWPSNDSSGRRPLPEHDRIIFAFRGIAVCSIALNDEPTAVAAVDKILKQHASDKNIAEVAFSVAEPFREKRNYVQARRLYQHILDNHPESPQAFRSYRGAVLCSIALRDETSAAAATEEMLERYPKQKGIAEAVYDIAESYRNHGDWSESRRLYQYILDRHPTHDRAVWSQRGFIYSSMALGDDPNTEAGIRKLLTDFSADSDLPRAVYQVAGSLGIKKDARAAELYQYIIDKYPGDDVALFARVKQGSVKLWAGDEAGATLIYNKMLSDYAKHPSFVQAALLIAEGYYDKAVLEGTQGRQKQAEQYYLKAITEAQRVVVQLPETLYATAGAYHLCAECYRHLGEDDEAIQHYQKIIDDWPDYEYGWHVQFMIGRTYRYLQKTGAIPESEGDLVIKDVYQRVVQNYPNCPAADAARTWLGYYETKSREGGRK